MIDNNPFQKMTHDLSNKFMILKGYIILMQLDSKHIKPETIQKLAYTLTSAAAALNHFKSSDEYVFYNADYKK